MWQVISLRYLALGLLASSTAVHSRAQTSNPVSTFFNNRAKHASADDIAEHHRYVLLFDELRLVDRPVVEQGLSTIDREVETCADRSCKLYAVGLLGVLRTREDGPELLVSQASLLDRLSQDPDETIRTSALLTLTTLGTERPELVVPTLKKVISSPSSTNSTGALAAGFLRKDASNDSEAMSMVVQFLQRKDFTVEGRARALAAASILPSNSEALVNELISALDETDTRVKVAALIGISNQGPRGIALARSALESKAADARESDRIRSLAIKALNGPLGEDPEARSATVTP